MRAANHLVTEHADLHYHRLQRQQTLPVDLDKVFPFFEKPENLALITPPDLRFRLVTASPVTMQKGTVIDYTLRLGGIPVRWRSLISNYQPPMCFVDEQLRGPYAYWRHTHRFGTGTDGTTLKDEIVYALPKGLPAIIEKLTHTFYVRPKLESIFDFRAAFYADYFRNCCNSQIKSAAISARTAP